MGGGKNRPTVVSTGDASAAQSASSRHGSNDGGNRNASSQSSSTSCEEEEVLRDPCYLYKMSIDEVWEDAPEEPTPPPPRPRSAVHDEIVACDEDLLKIQQGLDAQHQKRRPDKAVLKSLRQRRDEGQELMMKLLIEFYHTDSKPSVETVRSKNRSFSVVRHMPREWVESLVESKDKMRSLTRDLRKKLQEWDKKHDEHERLKRELMAFTAELEEKLREVDSAKAALERRRRRTRMREEALEKAEAKVEAAGGRAKRYWRKRGRKTAEANLERSKQKLRDLESAHRAAIAAYERKASAFNALDAKEPKAYSELQAIHGETKTLKDKLVAVETSVLKIRNTLTSPAHIQIVAGSKEPWYLNLEGKSEMDEDGERHHKSAAKPDGTPKIKVKLDADNDSSGGPTHPKGYAWGPSAIGLYCSDDPPPAGAPGPHPYLDCTVLPAREQDPWPFPAPAAKGKTLEFEAWQAKQFDESLQVPAYTVIGRILAGWNMCVRVVRIIKEIFSRNPRVSMISLRARSCGYKPTGRTHNVTSDLQATLEVFPSDSFEFSVTTSAFAGIAYSREVVRSDASNPVAETGQAQYDSSGSKDQTEDTESFSVQGAFGALRDTHSVTKIEGTGGGADKSLVIVSDVKQRGFTTEVHSATDDSHDNTFRGEDYSLDFHQTSTTDFSGNKTGGTLAFSESGSMVDRRDESGEIRSDDDYRADGDFKSGSFDYDSSSGTDRVTRVPPYPSTFFPLCPVDISFKRNDLEDEFTQHAKSVVGNLIFISRNVAAFAGRLSNWVPSMGFGFNFSFDILSGSFTYYKQHREHIDKRVYVYSKGTVDITCFSTSLTLWGGVWFELLMLEFKAVVEIILSGKVGVKGQLESTHPDAVVRGNLGFGPTGGVGAKVQIRFVVGQADWCSAAVGVRTGIDIEMIAWTQHQEGPHVTWDATFTGVTAFITARLALVGGWEYERKFCKEKKLAERRWPDVTDGDVLERQNREMESLTEEAILEAQEMSAKSEASREKNRASVRSNS